MPRPTTKTQLISASTKEFSALLNFIDSLPEEKRSITFKNASLYKNCRDVLAHLHHWQLLFLEWYTVGMRGEKPIIPSKGHSWKTTPQLNIEIQSIYNNVPLHEITKELEQSFSTLQKIIEVHSEEELFVKKKFKWTGSTSLASYIISASSSHYAWALKYLKRMYK